MGSGIAPIRDGELDTADVAVVGITDESSGATCTGALIAPDLVLTAQHCVAAVADIGPCTQGTFGAPGSASSYYVTTRPMFTFDPGDYHPVAEVRVPPGGDRFCGRDIVLLRLAAPVAANEAAPIAPRLAPAAEVAEPYSAVGYGATDDAGTGAGERRRRDALAVACTGDGCASAFLDTAEWRGEAGVCQGDSGGPALDASGAVFGVASRGAFGCLDPVYTSVAAHGGWLVDEAVRAAGLGGYPPPAWTGVAPPVDAGLPDAPADAATGADAATAADGGGGGCCAASAGPGPGTLALAVVTAVLLGRARRRRPAA